MVDSRSRVRGRILATSLMLGIGFALAAPGDLDTDFGDSGLVSLKFSEFGHAATEILQQTDGKLIVVGLGDVDLANDDDFIVARLLQDGTLDPGFGTNGVSVVDFAGFFDIPHAAVLQSDGKIVLAGAVGVSDSASNIGLARFNTNGTLDETFGTDGWATVDLGGGDDAAIRLIVQPGGQLVTAGWTNADGTYRPAFVRLNANGTSDATFGTAGTTILDFGAVDSQSYDFAAQSDGKLVSVGPVTTNVETTVGIARLSADGIPDMTFGTNGLLTLESAGGFELAQAVAIQADDSIVIASFEFADGANYLNGVLRRRDANGDADNTFGTGGKAVVDLGSESVFASVIVLSGGMLAVTGYRLTDEFFRDLIVSRFSSTGQLDQVFGIDGVATADFGDADVVASSEAFDLIQQIDGKLVATGRNFNTGSIALARFDDAAASAGRIGFTATFRVAAESEPAVSYTVRRTGGTTGPVSVDYATTADGAEPGSDFEDTNGTLTWNDGEADDKALTINLIDDSDPEGSESFLLTLTSPTGGAVLAASAASTSIQSEDGPGQLAFPFASFTLIGTEGESVILVPVARIRGLEGEVSVSYVAGNGSATADVDFVTSGTLTWADGDTEGKFITVNYLEDTDAEGEESFEIVLQNATGGATIATSLGIQDMAITDNDEGFGLQSTVVSVTESSGALLVTALRNDASNRAASVDYSTANGTATAGSDYSAASGTLTWSAGEASPKTFQIPITNDSADENDEGFTVSLSNPTGGLALAPNSTASVTIVDNDTAGGGSGGGGGGATGVVELLLALGALFARRRRRCRGHACLIEFTATQGKWHDWRSTAT